MKYSFFQKFLYLEIRFKAKSSFTHGTQLIDLLAILEKSLNRAIFSYIFTQEVRLSAVGASISIMHIRKFYICNEISFDPHSFLE